MQCTTMRAKHAEPVKPPDTKLNQISGLEFFKLSYFLKISITQKVSLFYVYDWQKRDVNSSQQPSFCLEIVDKMYRVFYISLL